MEIAVLRPIKFKRRKVSAVRDFPRGCGPSAVRTVALKQRIGGSDLPNGLLVKFDGDSRTDGPNGLHAPPPPPVAAAATSRVTLITDQLELPKEGCGQSSNRPGLSKLDFDQSELSNGNSDQPELLKPNSDQLKLLKNSSCQMVLPKGSSDQPEQLGAVKTVDLNSNHLSSRRYPPPKRRKVSAVRDYPVGCGRVSQSIKEGSLEVTPLAPVKCKSLIAEKAPSVNQQLSIESSTDFKYTLNAEKAHAVNQQLSIESSAEFKYTSTDPTEAKVETKQTKQTCEVLRDSDGEGHDNDGEKKLATKQLALSESSIRTASVENFNGESKRNDVKQVREMAQEIPNGARVKSSLKSSLGEIVVEECNNSKIVARSDSKKKFEGRDLKQLSESFVVEQRSSSKPSLDSRSQPGIKFRTKTGSSMVGKPHLKGPVKHPGDSKDLKRKFKEEVEDDQTEAGGSMEACDDKIVVQALVASQTCPWRQDGKSGVITEVKKERKSLTKNSGMKGVSFVSRLKGEVALGGEEDYTPTAKDNGQALVIYKNKSLNKNSGMKGTSSGSRLKGEVASGGEEDYTTTARDNGQALVIYKNKSLTKNSGMKGASSVSRLKGEVASGGEEDTPTAEENGQALVIYKNPREVTLTPLVPPRPNSRSGNDVVSDRTKVKRVLRLFQGASRKLLQELESRPKDPQKKRVDLLVSRQLKDRGLWVNYDGSGTIGHVPGVEVGDEFHYRVELSIVGLHRPFQGGIDFMKKNGRNLATSIVASGGYKDDMDSSDVLIYHGSGGSPAVGGKPAVDQKLERGNLSLKNSIDAKSPVRVIHGFKELKVSHRDAKPKAVSTFTYDGLYVVEECRKEMGPEGFSVFKFQLRRMAGQPELALKEAKRSKKARVREGLCIEDISGGKETFPICAVNTIDDDRPIPFKYITEIMYPLSYVHIPPSGCDCTHGCSESSVTEKCACAIKNAGENPFNNDGAIVEARPLVYECGPSCRCPPSCYNRVSQHGIQIRLELFKTKSRGWGVRSLDSIPSGTFICEYIGEMLQDSDAELRSNDEYLFDIGHNYEDPSLWEGFRTFTPSMQSGSICKTTEEVGFTIDAAEYGNIGRFINHSCSPNIYAQNVLYDHDDKRMPHIMFFAADNIPPLQELTYHYNYSVDQVRDSEGNIKRKTCYCGSPDCTGRLY